MPGFDLVYFCPVEASLDEPNLRQTQDAWPTMFDAAHKTIDIEQFYVTPSTGEPLDQSLQVPERGVNIRVILEKPNVWRRRLKSAFDPENRLNPWVFGGVFRAFTSA